MSQYDIYVKDAASDDLSPPIHPCVIQSLFIESLRKTLNFGGCFTVTEQIVIRSKIGECEEKDHLKLHLLHIYYIVI